MLDPSVEAWILTNASAPVRKQAEEGLLDNQEALQVIRDELFASLAGRKLFHPLEADDVCEHEDAVEFVTQPPTKLTRVQFAAKEDFVTHAPPGATVTVHDHVGRCITCGLKAHKLSIRVAIDWNGRVLARHYAL